MTETGRWEEGQEATCGRANFGRAVSQTGHNDLGLDYKTPGRAKFALSLELTRQQVKMMISTPETVKIISSDQLETLIEKSTLSAHSEILEKMINATSAASESGLGTLQIVVEEPKEEVDLLVKALDKAELDRGLKEWGILATLAEKYDVRLIKAECAAALWWVSFLSEYESDYQLRYMHVQGEEAEPPS